MSENISRELNSILDSILQCLHRQEKLEQKKQNKRNDDSDDDENDSNRDSDDDDDDDDSDDLGSDDDEEQQKYNVDKQDLESAKYQDKLTMGNFLSDTLEIDEF